MFKRPHHQRIQRLLHALDSELFASAECDGIRTFIEVDGVPIKFEIVQEGG